MVGKWLRPLRNFDQYQETRYPRHRYLAPLYHPIRAPTKKNKRNYRHVNNLNIVIYNAWKRLLISCDLPIIKIDHMIWTNSQDIYYSFVLLSRCSIGQWFESPYHYQTVLISYLRFFLSITSDYKKGLFLLPLVRFRYNTSTPLEFSIDGFQCLYLCKQ